MRGRAQGPRTLVGRPISSGGDGGGAEQHPQLGHEPGGGLDVEPVGQAQHLALADVEEHLRLARVLAQQVLELRQQRSLSAAGATG